MSFKNRHTKKAIRGKCIDELKHTPEYQWYKGKFIQIKEVPIRQGKVG